MISDYITFGNPRATQATSLQRAVERLTKEIGARQAAGSLDGPGPIFVGIGASLAAVAAPVWSLRSRGIHS